MGPRPRTPRAARRATRTTPPRSPRLLGGLGGGGGGGLRPARARLGHRGVHPPAGRLLRRGRHEAHVRRGLALRPRRLRQLPRPDRAFATTVADAALLLEVIGGHDPATARRSTGPPRRPVEAREGVDGLRVGLCAQLLTGAAPDVAARVHEAARPWPWPGAGRGGLDPEFDYGLSAYYLLAPARRPPTWPATTGSATGCGLMPRTRRP